MVLDATDDRNRIAATERAPHAAPLMPTQPASRDAEAPGSAIGDATDFAPSFATPVPAAADRSKSAAFEPLAPGQQCAGFDIVRELGRGAFGVVYLAVEKTLDRHVALKVTKAVGEEGRSMARLEHPNIVQVFSESVETGRGLRLLCMQYVPGTTLAAVIDAIGRRGAADWRGGDYLEVIDSLSTAPASFDAAALRERRLLEQSDRIATICWIGARLADALGHAHQRQVLHRDIKPANILISQYGHPLLADFNLAFRSLEPGATASELFGGTLEYMAPEHLDAFNPSNSTPRDAVGETCDLYSLGVVLCELASGSLPFGPSPRTGRLSAALASMAEARREPVGRLPPSGSPVLDQVLRRCLHPSPDRRYQTAAEMSAALDGCRDFRPVERWLPKSPQPNTQDPAAVAATWGRTVRGQVDVLVRPLKASATRHPFVWLAVLALAPQALGSIVNISYNQLRIVDNLTTAQQATFGHLVLAYNLLVYPLCIVLGLRAVVPVARTWREMQSAPAVDAAVVTAARQQALGFPRWAAVLACLGWFPGILFFPAGLQLLSGSIEGHVFWHFAVSFAISGLIGVTYALLLVQCLVICVFYPRLWREVSGFRTIAARELAPVGARLRLFQVLAGAIPLVGAILIVSTGPGQFTQGQYDLFRVLVTALIGMGMVGFQVALLVTGAVSARLQVITGGATGPCH